MADGLPYYFVILTINVINAVFIVFPGWQFKVCYYVFGPIRFVESSRPYDVYCRM